MTKSRSAGKLESAKKPLENDGLSEHERETLRPGRGSRPSWRPRQSDVHELVLPADDSPLPDLPGSIEAAILDVLEQVPGDEYAPAPRARSTKRK